MVARTCTGGVRTMMELSWSLFFKQHLHEDMGEMSIAESDWKWKERLLGEAHRMRTCELALTVANAEKSLRKECGVR